MKFDATYGKIETTEKDCPSRAKKTILNKEDGPRYRLLAHRVATIISCHQCGKQRCVFSFDGSITPKGQREIEDVMYSCGMGLKNSIFTSTNISCNSPIENAYYLSRSANSKLICYHCGEDHILTNSYKQNKKNFKTVYPTCIRCSETGKKEFCAIPLNKKSNINKQGQVSTERVAKIVKLTAIIAGPSKPTATDVVADVSSTTAEPSDSVDKAVTAKPSDCIDEVVAVKPDAGRADNSARCSKTRDIGKRKLNDDDADIQFHVSPTKKQSGTMDTWLKMSSEDFCSICNEEDPPTQRSDKVTWIDCDVCHKWAHTLCANKGTWLKVYRNSWVCEVHKTLNTLSG